MSVPRLWTADSAMPADRPRSGFRCVAMRAAVGSGIAALTTLAAVIFTALAALVASLTQGDAATLGRPWTLEQTVENADLIFEGTVVAIAFRDSDPLPDGDVTLPHTFVTYQVGDVVRGRPASRRLTLRFLGGWSDRSGRIMRLPHAPLFKLGDRDILFVAGNGAAACPLVTCGLARFRVWEGRVHNNEGLAVRVGADGRLGFGPDRMPHEHLSMEFPPAPEARLRDVRRQLQDPNLSAEERATLTRRLNDMSGPRVIGQGRVVADQPPAPPSTPPVPVAAFKALIAEISDRYPDPAVVTVSVSAEEPFTYPEQVLTPAEPPTRFPEPRTLTLEEQLLRQNNSNPVLRPQ